MGISYLTQRGGDKYKPFKRSIEHRISGHVSSFMLDGLTKIKDYAFSGCASLTSIDLPNSVTNIGDAAFKNCSSLSNITIPSSVNSIGMVNGSPGYDGAFSGCSLLEIIKIEAINPPSLGYNQFLYGPSQRSILVPAESVDSYKTAPNWSNWANLIQAIPEN